jgi:N-acetylglucosaminyldiphosphoundecaprenol N-acetyl-beta-D-mannosaminyltransferase
MKRIELLGVQMDASTMKETVDFIDSRVANNQFTQHVVINVAKLVHMQTDSKLRSSIEACDIINIDGMGVVWGARLLGKQVPERIAGIDLFHELLSLSASKSYPVFLLGAEPEIVKTTIQKINEQYPKLNVAGYHHGFFWENEDSVVHKIKESGAKLLFVAITSPKKENFINQWQDQLGVTFVMGVGGTFDVVAGKVKRAPTWMQKAGMEWLYRVIQEPKRMWKRYLTTNSKFLWLLLKARLTSSRKLKPDEHESGD